MHMRLETDVRPGMPRSVSRFVERYESGLPHSPLPPDRSVIDLLKRSLATSIENPAYSALMSRVLPDITSRKMAIFDTSHVDALVFPYAATFAEPIRNPVERADDPGFVKAPGRPSPSMTNRPQ